MKSYVWSNLINKYVDMDTGETFDASEYEKRLKYSINIPNNTSVWINDQKIDVSEFYDNVKLNEHGIFVYKRDKNGE